MQDLGPAPVMVNKVSDCKMAVVMESHLSSDQSMTCDRENTEVYSHPDNHQFYSPQSLNQIWSYLKTFVVAITALITQLSTDNKQ